MWMDSQSVFHKWNGKSMGETHGEETDSSPKNKGSRDLHFDCKVLTAQIRFLKGELSV